MLALVLLVASAICCGSVSALPYSASSPVIELTASNLESKVKAAGLMLVEFYAPWCGHCKALSPEYESLAKAMKGMIGIGAVDCDQHKSVGGEYGVKGFPTIKLLYVDGGKIKTLDYNGGRTAKEMMAFVFEKAKSLAMKRIGEKASSGGGSSGGGGGGNSGGGGGSKKGGSGGGGGGGVPSEFYTGTDVAGLSDANFEEEVLASEDMVFVEFYAPWCGHCKNLKPEWISAASQLKGKGAKVAAIDCTASQSTCQQYGVQGYPTIKWFGRNKKSPVDYNGPREANGIVQYAMQNGAKAPPPPEVRELVDQHVFDQHCLGDPSDEVAAKQLCFIAFLPDILDSKASGRNAYIAILKKIAEKFKDRPFSYLWASATQQRALEENFGVGGFGYPALVAFKPKDKYSLAKSAFELEHVVEFVERIRKGGESVMAVRGPLAEVVSSSPWDGKDAVVQVEDEFSLDDLMGDDNEGEGGAGCKADHEGEGSCKTEL